MGALFIECAADVDVIRGSSIQVLLTLEALRSYIIIRLYGRRQYSSSKRALRVGCTGRG